jgi:hypothetical protein
MTEPGASRRPRASAVLPVLVLFIAVAAASWAAFEWWRSPTRMANAPGCDLDYFLQLKRDGGIREVWVEGTRLYAEINPKVVHFQSTDDLRYIRTTVPPAVLADPKRFNELGEGLPPGKFHFAPGR